MQRVLLFITLSIFFCNNLLAQKAIISFERTSKNIGTINESDGKVNIVYTFSNTGNSPLIINNIKSSCGCTTPVWSNKPILPNRKAQIIAQMNPKNRSGSFTKTITVFSNAKNSTIRLIFTGKIIPRTKTLEDIYTYNMGGIRLKSKYIFLMNLKDSQIIRKNIELINTSNKDIYIRDCNLPKHIKIDLSDNKIGPNSKKRFLLSYNAKKKDDWGFLLDTIHFYINNKRKKQYSLIVSTTIKEDFSLLNKNKLINCPSISLSQNSYNFGVTTQDNKINYYFYLSNKGKSDLIIRRIKPSSPDLSYKIEKRIIHTGEKVKFYFSFKTKNRVGLQTKYFTIIANDPQRPISKFTLKGEIKKNY